jgi:gentisate 1,2-dioxygenase
MPAWHEHSHAASQHAVLLRVSDEPLMRMLNWVRVGDGASD